MLPGRGRAIRLTQSWGFQAGTTERQVERSQNVVKRVAKVGNCGISEGGEGGKDRSGVKDRLESKNRKFEQ